MQELDPARTDARRAQRWPRAWLLGTVLAVLAVLAMVMARMPELKLARQLPLSRSDATLQILGAGGLLGHKTSERVSRGLADAGDTAFLDDHLAAMNGLGGTPLIIDNRVELLVDGPATYAAMFAAIREAQHYVLIESFIFEDTTSGDTSLLELLRQAAGRGVSVFVLYDAVGSMSTDAAFLEALEAAGVRLQAFNPIDPRAGRMQRLNNRDHRKLLIVDGTTAFAGGINFSRAYRSGSRAIASGGTPRTDDGWRDTHLALRGPAVARLQRLFVDAWSSQEGPALPQMLAVDAPTVKAGGTVTQLLASSPDDELNEVYASTLLAIEFARRSVDITMAYFVPDDALELALQTAAKRGVRVRMIMPGYSDFDGVFQAGRAHYAGLLDSGVELYELEDALLHAKTMVVDGIWSSVGSTNFDWRSFVHNSELNVVVIDEAFAQRMGAVFDGDLARATQLDSESWARRPVFDRLKERFWVLLQYYL